MKNFFAKMLDLELLHRHNMGVDQWGTRGTRSPTSWPEGSAHEMSSETAAEIAPIITHIFQQSYNTSKLPDDWLQALVTQIHKKKLKSDPANYRPISLTCILCKVMEHIILSNMWKHLHKHNIILHFQYGFQSGLSCESQLIETVHDWITSHR